MSSINKTKTTISTYNKGARAYARKFNEIGPRVNDIKKVFSYIEKINPLVVEIGCGNGRDGREIMKYTTKYIGIDLSQSMVNLAKILQPNGDFRVADLETFDYPLNSDIIFSFASLLHSNRTKVKQILKHIHRSLIHGGIFLISLKYGEYRELQKDDEFGTRYFYLYTPEDIKKLAGEKYKVLWEDKQTLKGIDWFTIILRKILYLKNKTIY